MTTVTLELPDQVVLRVQQRAVSRGVSLSQEVSDILETTTNGSHDVQRIDAIRRMNELFDQGSGFRAEPRIPREELSERGSLR